MVESQVSYSRLRERRVLITGAASGIGRRTAQLFAAEGAALTLLDRSTEGLAETARETRGLAAEADVTDETSVANAVEQGAEAMGGIDGIVNAAGIVIHGSLRTFGHSRTGKFVDRAVAAGALEKPIAAAVDHSRHLAVAWHIFPAVPCVPLRIDLGGDVHAANLQHRRHATLRHFYAVRVNLFPDNACQILPNHGRRDFLSPRRPRPVLKRRRLHHRHAFQFIACQVLRAALDRLVAGR